MILLRTISPIESNRSHMVGSFMTIVLLLYLSLANPTPVCNAQGWPVVPSTPDPDRPGLPRLVKLGPGIHEVKDNSLAFTRLRNRGGTSCLYGPAKKLPVTLDLRRLDGHSVLVSYCCDGSNVWSEPVNYPVEKLEILIPTSESGPYFTPGDHKMTFRIEQNGNVVTDEDLAYRVNSRPVVEAANAEPLTFKVAPDGPVSLPLVTSDADGDEVSLYYRFDGEGEWMQADSDLGANVLPEGAFAGKADNGRNGFLEIAAWDGYDDSEELVRIGYSIEEQNSKEGLVEEMLSPAALVGIIVGTISVIALGSAIIVFATKKKPESSSTGLVEDA